MSLSHDIFSHYGMQVSHIEAINERVKIIDVGEKKYCLKYVENHDMEKIYHHLQALQLDCFVVLYLNDEHCVLTHSEGRYFYLMDYLCKDQQLSYDIQIKFYLQTLIYLHQHSFFYHTVDKSYFQQFIDDLLEMIDHRFEYYHQLMINFEKMHYRSPSGWMMVLNYYRLEETLKKARVYALQLKKYVSDVYEVRLSLVYNNFNYNHIFMESRQLISIDHIKIDYCIQDIFDIYQHYHHVIGYNHVVLSYYLQEVTLDGLEKRILQCLFHVLPIVTLNDNEVDNITKMSQFISYLDALETLNQKLAID